MTTGIMLDPTLALTRRGQEWIRRATSHTPPPLLVSDTLMAALASDDQRALAIYRSAWVSGHPSWPHHISGVQRVRAHDDPMDEVAAHLLAGDSGQRVAADTWYAINDGALLAARRTPTFDQLVQAGVRLVIEGRRKYLDVVDQLASEFAFELVYSLARRSRYFAVGPAACADPGWDRSPAMLIYDAGVGAYH
jgi:hypothetical protein